MSEDQQSDRNQNPDRGSNSDRFKPILIWLVVIGALFSLYFFSDPRPRTKNVWTIRDVIKAAEEGRIAKGNIKSDPKGGPDWSEITVTLKESTQGQEQIYVAKGRLTEGSLERLQSTGLFQEHPASTLFTDTA